MQYLSRELPQRLAGIEKRLIFVSHQDPIVHGDPMCPEEASVLAQFKTFKEIASGQVPRRARSHLTPQLVDLTNCWKIACDNWHSTLTILFPSNPWGWPEAGPCLLGLHVARSWTLPPGAPCPCRCSPLLLAILARGLVPGIRMWDSQELCLSDQDKTSAPGGPLTPTKGRPTVPATAWGSQSTTPKGQRPSANSP